MKNIDIAVLIPCFNEEYSIGKVVADFRQSLPQALIYVYDNNSTDNTVRIAESAGAIIRHERRQGKGYVVRRMFSDIEADVYILVDGDNTYTAEDAEKMVRLLVTEEHDLVNASREPVEEKAFPAGHMFGNFLLSGIVKVIFGSENHDMLSGYKALSRRFVKSFPLQSRGFEIETELLVHALGIGISISEIQSSYKARHHDSASKLRKYRDGWRILVLIIHLIRDERPFLFFSVIAFVLGGLSLIAGLPVILEFMHTGLVPRFPTAFLAMGLGLLSVHSLAAGIVLDSVSRARWENKILSYLSYKSPHKNLS